MQRTMVRHMKCAVAENGVLIIDRVGAGVGIIMYAPDRGVAAGIHVLAPVSDRPAPVNPARFANTAIPHALFQMEKLGAGAPSSIAIAGGVTMPGLPEPLDMGPRIVSAVKKAFAKANLKVKLEKVGGHRIRTMILNIDAGKIKIA